MSRDHESFDRLRTGLRPIVCGAGGRVEQRGRGARERRRGGAGVIQGHEELEVYKLVFQAAMKIFALTKQFPREETYSLTDQIRRSSRAVCSNIAEAWRKGGTRRPL
jgi:hypothetical protein